MRPAWILCALPLLASSLSAAPGRPLLVTVDDLPVAAGRLHADTGERLRITRDLLAALERHRVPAVGFVVWDQVKSEADVALLERWLEAGHELGNHSAGHLDYSRTDAATYLGDVEAGRAGLAGLLARHERRLRFFRFPFLREGETEAKLDAAREALARSGQLALPVTIDNQDWDFERPWVEARRAADRAAMERIGDDYQRAVRTEVLAQTALGDELFGREVPQILLLHANEVGAAQWDALFAWLVARGFRFASADEVLADPALTSPHRYVAGPGGSLWHRLRRERESAAVQAAVRALLLAQEEAWNRGDVEAFCAFYAEDASFAGASGVSRGRAALVERYRARYPDRAAMGTLTLAPLEIREAWGNEASLLGDAVPSRTHGVGVLARWTLSRENGDDASGLTLLVLHRQAGRWVVVQDASL